MPWRPAANSTVSTAILLPLANLQTTLPSSNFEIVLILSFMRSWMLQSRR